MYCQFENRYTLTEEMIQKYVRQIVCRRLTRCCAALFAVLVSACGLSWYLSVHSAAAVFGALALTCVVVGLAAPVLVASRMRTSAASDLKVSEIVVQFGDRILVLGRGGEIWFDYSEIRSVRILGGFSALLVGKREAIFLTPSGFSKGDRLTFWRFFRSKRPDLWAKTAV